MIRIYCEKGSVLPEDFLQTEIPQEASIAILSDDERVSEKINFFKEKNIPIIVMTKDASRVASLLNSGAKAVILTEKVRPEIIKRSLGLIRNL